MYTESKAQEEQRTKAFTYHLPGQSQPERYQEIRTSGNRAARLFNNLCPPSRELSLAQTHLEQAVMWANAAIARHELPLDPPNI